MPQSVLASAVFPLTAAEMDTEKYSLREDMRRARKTLVVKNLHSTNQSGVVWAVMFRGRGFTPCKCRLTNTNISFLVVRECHLYNNCAQICTPSA